jgi:hypothetical protein
MVHKTNLFLFAMFVTFSLFEYTHQVPMVCGSQAITGKMWFMWAVMAAMSIRKQ